MIDVEIRMEKKITTGEFITTFYRIYFDPQSQWHDIYGDELPVRWVWWHDRRDLRWERW